MDEVEDDNSSCDSIDIADAVRPNNVPESPTLRLDLSRGLQRILR